MADFKGEKSSSNVTNNDTISEDEVVASYVPPRYLFLLFIIYRFTAFDILFGGFLGEIKAFAFCQPCKKMSNVS